MSLLEHPKAQAILADAVLTPEAVRGCEDRLARFLERYLPRFRRAEQRHNAALVIRGLLSGLQRKTCEPIAVEAGVHRKPIQFLVGAGKGEDEAVMAEIRRHVAEERGDDQAVLILDASTFPKSGADSCGVGRQWCGRLGKQENCQRGIFLAYAVAGGYAPLDRQLYLPRDWADDPARREKCHVPEDVKFREGWRIAAELIERSRPGLPHGWVNSAVPHNSAPGCVAGASVTSSMCPATRSSATWNAAGPSVEPAGVPGRRCRSAGSTPGRPGSRRDAGPG